MKWIDCSKKMPESGSYVLVCNVNVIGVKEVIRFYFDGEWYDENGHSTRQMFTYEYFTHWQSLPKPPKSQ